MKPVVLGLFTFVRVWIALLFGSFIICPTQTALATVSGNAPSSSLPELPRVFLDTAYVPPNGKHLDVKAGDDFQAALNAAQPGDLITLEAGATFAGPFILPKKSGDKWIVIRTSSADAALPSEGSRMTPAYSKVLPKIVAPGRNAPALKTEPGAHHFRFLGIEFKKLTADTVANVLLALGDGSKRQTEHQQIPHHLVFDRVYVHGEKTNGVKHCVVLSSASTAVIDSYIADCKITGFDSQAIVGWNGPGPFKIVNNYLEGAGENVMFGGGDAANADLTPADIEFRKNHLVKPLSRKIDDPGYAGVPWNIKNLFEFKNARRILIDGNIFEHCWPHAQRGFAILFTPRHDNTAPWTGIQDVTFTNNIVRHATHGLGISGQDSTHVTDRTMRILVRNNLFDDVGGARWSGGGILFQILNGAMDVVIENNTAVHTGTIIMAEGPPQLRFVFRNNIVLHNTYGVHNTGSGVNRSFPDWIFEGNVIVGTPPSLIKRYPVNNFFSAALTEVQFVNSVIGNYRLSATSPYKRAGIGGRDIGADIDAIEEAVGEAAVRVPSARKAAP